MRNEILYVVYASLASPTGGGRTRVISSAKQAQKHGFTVKTLCFFPFHHAFTKGKFLIKGKSSLAAEINGKVHYLPRLPLTRIKWVGALNDWYCGLSVFILCLLAGIRVIHCHGVRPALFALTARRISKKLRVAADIHGAVSEEYLYKKQLTTLDKQAKALELNELLVLSNADWLIFVSEAMKKYYERKYSRTYSRSSVIPCLTDDAGKNLNDARMTLRRKNNLEDKLVFCYVGSGESYQLPDKMCRFFKDVLVAFPKSFLLIYSHHQAAFLKYINDSGIDSQYYKIGAVSHSEIFDVLQVGDIGFLLRDDSIVNQVSSPTKFGEYCLSGVPVITTDSVGDISSIVKENKLGLIVDLDELTVNADVTAFIADVVRNRLDYSTRCSRFIREEFTWDAYGLTLKNLYSALNE